MTKRLLALLLAMWIPVQSFAAVAQADPDQLMAMVDEYIKEVQATPKDADPAFADAQAAYFAEAMAVETRSLEPEDFNLFMFAVMSRYINRPAERVPLFRYIKSVRAWVAADLENTAQLENGALHYMNPANYSWYTWVVIGAGVIIGRGILKGPLRSTRFAQSMERMQLQSAKWKAPYRIGFRTATHPAMVASYAGAGLGLLQYELEKNKLHRLDPMVLTNVVQTQLACYLSYQALGLEDRFNAAAEDEERLSREYAVLDKDIGSVLDQAHVLIEQFARLDNISANEPDFLKAMNSLPKAKTFKDFREVLTAADKANDGQCRQMSLTNLIIQVGKMREALKASYDNMIPAEEPPQRMEKL